MYILGHAGVLPWTVNLRPKGLERLTVPYRELMLLSPSTEELLSLSHCNSVRNLMEHGKQVFQLLKYMNHRQHSLHTA